MSTLRSAIIRLANENPTLRSKLVPLLRQASDEDPFEFEVLVSGYKKLVEYFAGLTKPSSHVTEDKTHPSPIPGGVTRELTTVFTYDYLRHGFSQNPFTVIFGMYTDSDHRHNHDVGVLYLDTHKDKLRRYYGVGGAEFKKNLLTMRGALRSMALNGFYDLAQGGTIKIPDLEAPELKQLGLDDFAKLQEFSHRNQRSGPLTIEEDGAARSRAEKRRTRFAGGVSWSKKDQNSVQSSDGRFYIRKKTERYPSGLVVIYKLSDRNVTLSDIFDSLVKAKAAAEKLALEQPVEMPPNPEVKVFDLVKKALKSKGIKVVLDKYTIKKLKAPDQSLYLMKDVMSALRAAFPNEGRVGFDYEGFLIRPEGRFSRAADDFVLEEILISRLF